MADSLFDAMKGGAPRIASIGLLRLDPLAFARPIDTVTFSGGVSEYVYGWECGHFGDLGSLLAAEIRNRVVAAGMRLGPPGAGLRGTAIGRSQYTTPVSGGRCF